MLRDKMHDKFRYLEICNIFGKGGRAHLHK